MVDNDLLMGPQGKNGEILPEWIALRQAFSRVLAWVEERDGVLEHERLGRFELKWHSNEREYAPEMTELEHILQRASFNRQSGIVYSGLDSNEQKIPLSIGEMAVAEAHFELIRHLQNDLLSKGIKKTGCSDIYFPNDEHYENISPNVWKSDGIVEVDEDVWLYAPLPDYKKSFLEKGFSVKSGENEFWADVKVKRKFIESIFFDNRKPQNKLTFSQSGVHFYFRGRHFSVGKLKGALLLSVLLANPNKEIKSTDLEKASAFLDENLFDVAECLDVAINAPAVFENEKIIGKHATDIWNSIKYFKKKLMRIDRDFHDYLWVSENFSLIKRSKNSFSYVGDERWT